MADYKIDFQKSRGEKKTDHFPKIFRHYNSKANKISYFQIFNYNIEKKENLSVFKLELCK